MISDELRKAVNDISDPSIHEDDRLLRFRAFCPRVVVGRPKIRQARTLEVKEAQKMWAVEA